MTDRPCLCWSDPSCADHGGSHCCMRIPGVDYDDLDTPLPCGHEPEGRQIEQAARQAQLAGQTSIDDHLNGNRSESTLRNLAWGTPSENSADTVRHGHHPHSVKTHCPMGHPYAGDNLYIHPTGQRVCRTCRRTQQLAWLRRRKS